MTDLKLHQSSTTAPSRPKAFDLEVCEALADRCQEIFLKHPEVKAISASIAWNGTLNESNIQSAIWIGPQGGVATADGIFVSIFQTMKLLDQQVGRAMLFKDQLQKTVNNLAEEVRLKREELRQLREEAA